MRYIALQQPGEAADVLHSAAFWLATELWLARHRPDEQWLMTWRTRPSAICGRHQNAEAEINTAYCRQHGIDIVQRHSGGGCVYADLNNVMVSYLTPAVGTIEESFADFTAMLVAMLRSEGFAAEVSGRNDVLIDGCKVSGFAFRRLTLPRSGKCVDIIHGTMLVDADTATMAAVLTPSVAKTAAKGVKSVRSRVTWLRQLQPDYSTARFEAAVRAMADEPTLMLTPADVAEIRQQMPAAPKVGECENSSIGTTAYVPNVGTLNLRVELSDDGTSIKTVSFGGDFFAAESAEPAQMLNSCLAGCPVAEEAISASVADFRAVRGLQPSELAAIVMTECRRAREAKVHN